MVWKIQHCLEESDPVVLICAVYAMSELSDKIPQIYLRLVPIFFRLLTNSYNNSMINKVVKLLGILE